MIREENGSHLGSGTNAVLSFGECFTGVKVSKVLHVKNTTDASLLVQLSSDRPSDISFELKAHRDMVQEWNRENDLNGKDKESYAALPHGVNNDDDITAAPVLVSEQNLSDDEDGEDDEEIVQDNEEEVNIFQFFRVFLRFDV